MLKIMLMFLKSHYFQTFCILFVIDVGPKCYAIPFPPLFSHWLQRHILRSKSLLCTKKYSDADVIKMLDILIDNNFVEFGGRIFQQTIGITVYLCLPTCFYTRTRRSFLKVGKNHLAQQLNFIYRYDVLSLKTQNVLEYLEFIYSHELEIKETTETAASSSYLNC